MKVLKVESKNFYLEKNVGSVFISASENKNNAEVRVINIKEDYKFFIEGSELKNLINELLAKEVLEIL